MSTQVDVLAVMDEFALYVRNVSSKHALQGDIAEARAAVAELIESSQVLLDEWNRQDAGRFDGMTAKAFFAAEARFRAALARVGGAK